MEYNTQRNHLKLREYGRNVQNLVAVIKNETDKEKRSKHAATLVELMKMINPNLNQDTQDYDQKIWDDIYIISEFDLEVDSPYTRPEPSLLDKKPQRVPYASNQIKYKHYGRSMELLIEKAILLEDPKEKEGAVIVIGKLMKSFFHTWNKDLIEDEQVLMNIKRMSDNKLDINIDNVKEFKLFDLGKPAYSKHRKSSNGPKGGSKGRKFQSNSNSNNNPNNRRRRFTK
jgi:hypothetical protein